MSGSVVAAGGYHHEIETRPVAQWRPRAVQTLSRWGLRCIDHDDAVTLLANWQEGFGQLEDYCKEADPADCARHRAADRCINPCWQEPLPLEED